MEDFSDIHALHLFSFVHRSMKVYLLMCSSNTEHTFSGMIGLNAPHTTFPIHRTQTKRISHRHSLSSLATCSRTGDSFAMPAAPSSKCHDSKCCTRCNIQGLEISLLSWVNSWGWIAYPNYWDIWSGGITSYGSFKKWVAGCVNTAGKTRQEW